MTILVPQTLQELESHTWELESGGLFSKSQHWLLKDIPISTAAAPAVHRSCSFQN